MAQDSDDFFVLHVMAGHSGYQKFSGPVVRVLGISGFQKWYPKSVGKKKNPKIRVPENSGSGSGFTRITRNSGTPHMQYKIKSNTPNHTSSSHVQTDSSNEIN